MKIAKVSAPNVINEASKVLRAGGIILYPTDTLYGLGADALSDKAVAKVYSVKERDEWKSVHCVVADMKTADVYAEVNDYARLLAKKFLPGPLTLVLRKRKEIKTGIARERRTIGIRIPNSPFCIALAREFGPFTTTSANRSGYAPEMSVEKILAQMKDSSELIDFVIDDGELPETQPSTVVDLSGDTPIILREGAIPASLIWEELEERY